jgi:glutaredoxin
MLCVEIFTKKNCCLCEEAKKVLYGVKRIIPFELKEVDIEKDKDLLKRYGNEVPVIFINGRKTFKYKINEKVLINRLKREVT